MKPKCECPSKLLPSGHMLIVQHYRFCMFFRERPPAEDNPGVPKEMPVEYVVRRSDGTKYYVDDRTGAGTATSNRRGHARRFKTRHAAWECVTLCGVPENWIPKKIKPRR